jgi:hypothetical protein
VRGRRIVKGLAIGAAGLVGLLAVSVLAATFLLQGERLAGVVRKALPPMRGKIELRAPVLARAGPDRSPQ